jgi:hypothetical protein
MKAQYEVHLYTPTGVWLKTLTKRITRLTWSRKLGEVGSFEVTLSDRLQPVDVNLFPLNGRVLIYRKPSAKETARLEFVGFIRGWRYETDNKGVTRYTFHGEDQNGLLASRVCWPFIPYLTGFWKDVYTEYIDTLMRTMVNNNLGAGEDNPALRDVMTSNGAGLTIGAEASATATSCTLAGKVSYNVAGVNLLELCRGLSELSRTFVADGATSAVPVYFDMCVDTPTTLTFRTRTTRWGMNRRADSGNPLAIGLSVGNLRIPAWRHDRMAEVTAGMGLYFAPGDGDSYNNKAWALDTARIGEGPLNRREACAVGSPPDTVAHTVLTDGEAKSEFTGMIQETAGCRYGVHWNMGDELTADFLRQQYNVMVMGVRVECEAGRESIEPIMEVME